VAGGFAYPGASVDDSAAFLFRRWLQRRSRPA